MRKLFICALLIVSNIFAQENKLIISSIYATSTDLPLEDNSIFNCFDSSYDTFWNTIKGSCEEEGVMIRLNEPTVVSKIDVLGTNGEDNLNLDLYIDGAGRGRHVNGEILNIFIKARDYNCKNSFSISEIKFYDANEQPYEIVVPEKVIANVVASSALTPKVAYGAINLIDGQKENGWAEGVPSSGVGQALLFKLNRKIRITDLSFWNGYQRSVKHFSSNSSAKRILVTDLKSGVSETYELANEMGVQQVKLKSPFITDALSIKFLEVYEGKKYKDLVISEIQFLNDGKYYSLQSEEFSKRIKANLEKGKNNPTLFKVLDKNISYHENNESKEGTYIKYTSNSRSILLRSNNTFVWYQNEYENIVDTADEEDEMGTDISKQIIADGSWYITKESLGKIKIKIFGKMFEPRDYSDIYKGEVTNETLRIFHDYLTLSKDKITGERIFETIPITE